MLVRVYFLRNIFILPSLTKDEVLAKQPARTNRALFSLSLFSIYLVLSLAFSPLCDSECVFSPLIG